MKILSAEKIRKGDQYTIEKEPISSTQLMARAAEAIYQWIEKQNFEKTRIFRVFSGIGNNGGDGLALASMLSRGGYLVSINVIHFSSQQSSDFQYYFSQVMNENLPIFNIHSSNQLPPINSADIVIDAILGSGLNRETESLVAQAIDHINQSKALIISIDIASGLFANTLNNFKSPIIKPNITLSLGFLKMAFLIPENEVFTGIFYQLEIGIHPQFVSEIEADAFYIDADMAKAILRPRSRYAHKGNFGHGLLIAGSRGKMGAAVLASKAALRTGIGLLTAHIPADGNEILQISIPEAMLSLDSDNYCFTDQIKDTSPHTIGIGPGIGQDPKTAQALKWLIQNTASPMVLDADALNILSENKTWIAFLPKGSILTPHPKEFERLFGKCSNSYQRIQKQKEMSIKYGLVIVLKGAHTTLSTPAGVLYVNSTGNPGMATAGSGDVLTGVILSLLSQNFSNIEAALFGVYLHGLAGDLSALEKGFEGLIASDIIDNLPKAFLNIYN